MSLRAKLDKITTWGQRKLFLSQIYRRAFGTDDGKLVLEDLFENFAWANRPTLARERGSEVVLAGSAFNEGQRSVWIYIQRKLHLSETEMREIAREAEHRADPTTTRHDPFEEVA